ncbi:MAG: hypothetical protein AAB495_04560 [Patescibacteria group bacterium]
MKTDRAKEKKTKDAPQDSSGQAPSVKPVLSLPKHSGQVLLAKFVLSLPKHSGQALVEVMIAVSILVVGFLGIMTLLSRALSLNRVVADNYIATYLAAEGIEVTKNILDGNAVQEGRAWNSGFQNGGFEIEYTSARDINTFPGCSGRKLYFDDIAKRYSYTETAYQTSFERCVSIELIDDNEVKVNSEVRWVTRGGGVFTTNLEDRFFDWRS